VINPSLIYELARQHRQDLLDEAAHERLVHLARSQAPHGPGAVATILKRARAVAGALRGAHTRYLDRRLQAGRPSL
jgi:hypothetical protein